MKKLLLLTITAILYSFASFAQLDSLYPSSGTICIGTPITVYGSDTTILGVWSSSNTAIATVGSSGVSWEGEVTGVSAGVVNITYNLGSFFEIGTYTIVALPASITGGPTAFCVGTTATFSDATTGGTWGTYYGYSSIDASTGVATGVSGGTDVIYYIVNGCSVTENVTVNATAIYNLDSFGTICLGSSITLADTVTGGTWSGSDPAVGTIDATTGYFTGISLGSVTISYTVSGICGAATVTELFNVSNTTPSAGAISGAATAYIGAPQVTLENLSSYGGTWSSSNTSIATIDPSLATITAITPGTTTISYTVTGCGPANTVTQVETISDIDGISGYVILASGSYYGDIKVWLITYDPGTYTLAAQDSVIVYCGGSGSVYYQFTGLTTDSFRVKAATITDSLGTVTGPYVPTYHDTSFYWDYADVIPYITGTTDVNENIGMLFGTDTTGPGFIGGNVLTGANRGTSAGIPVVGLDMFALNTTTHTIAGMTKTGSTGSYSFSSLPYGTYTIFPDSLNYATTSLGGITLSASAATYSDAGFAQNLINKTIVPLTEAVKNVTPAAATVTTFPNPTSGRLNIAWTEQTTEKGTVSITDITGRQVYTSTINMTQGAGITPIDLSAFTNGVYMISIKSATFDYNSKIEVMK